jgi:hypothetical protein
MDDSKERPGMSGAPLKIYFRDEPKPTTILEHRVSAPPCASDAPREPYVPVELPAIDPSTIEPLSPEEAAQEQREKQLAFHGKYWR